MSGGKDSRTRLIEDDRDGSITFSVLALRPGFRKSNAVIACNRETTRINKHKQRQGLTVVVHSGSTF